VNKAREKHWLKPNIKSSTTHYAEGNNMVSLAQTVVSKDISNPLIDEDLLKIIRDLIPSFPQIPYQFPSMEW